MSSRPRRPQGPALLGVGPPVFLAGMSAFGAAAWRMHPGLERLPEVYDEVEIPVYGMH